MNRQSDRRTYGQNCDSNSVRLVTTRTKSELAGSLCVLVAIYRGCFDAFKAVKQLTDNYVGCRNQTWNNRVRRWCLCDTDLCNRFPIEQNYKPLPDSTVRRRLRTHHHPLPPPQPALPKNYFKNSAAQAITLGGEEKDIQPALYRTVWTNWKAFPGTNRHGQSTDRADARERNSDGGSRTPDQLGHVVSHSVYPDRWKANVAAVVDRRHAKSSDSVARARPEPLTYRGEGHMSRSNYSASRGAEQYQPSIAESEAKRASTADRQNSWGICLNADD